MNTDANNEVVNEELDVQETHINDGDSQQVDELTIEEQLAKALEKIDELNDKINRLGKLSVDRHKMKVIYPHGEYVYCTKQVYTLLASFIDSEDMFLSNDTIVGICGWHKNRQ